jgi:hypothetical protein
MCENAKIGNNVLGNVIQFPDIKGTYTIPDEGTVTVDKKRNIEFLPNDNG